MNRAVPVFLVLASACASSPEATSSGLDAGLAEASAVPSVPRPGIADATSDVAAPRLTMAQIGAPILLSRTLKFAEGPCWDPRRQVLLLSDIEGDTIYQLELPSTLSVFRSPSHKANGLGFDREGRLLAAEHGSRSITRTLADGTVTPVASTFEGQRLNSPNDLVVRSDGSVYFTDPTFGLGSTPSALGFTGLYRMDAGDALHLEARIDGQPNGVALSPGEEILYVAATTANQIFSYRVATDGTLDGATAFSTVDSPDGLAVDAQGNLYVAAVEDGRGAVVVLNPSGLRLGAVTIGEKPTNVGFGGVDGRTLFVTARTALYSIAVPIAGR